MPEAQETAARNLLKTLLESTYPGVEVRADRLHASLGDEEPLIGIYPDETRGEARNKLINGINLVVQYFGHYEKKVDRGQSVDPTPIEEAAESFRLLLATDPKSNQVWYFDCTRIAYPHDPTGNITRFVAYVTAYAANVAQPIYETH